MSKIKKVVVTGLASLFLAAQPIAADDVKHSEKTIEYKIECSFFDAGEGYYKVIENEQDYNIELNLFSEGSSRLQDYKFVSEGYKEDNKFFPKDFNYNSVEKSETLEENIQREIFDTTKIQFDYENLKAQYYNHLETKGKTTEEKELKKDDIQITKDVKDILALFEDLKQEDLKDNYELKVIANGDIYPLELEKVKEETITIDEDSYQTNVYETYFKKDVFGMDSKVRIWIDTEEGHNILKYWIDDGPLWTSITITYKGKKSELR